VPSCETVWKLVAFGSPEISLRRREVLFVIQTGKNLAEYLRVVFLEIHG
jgi:hypothetical protein